MIRFAIKGLATRKLRTALTAIAIVLGVALITGTYVLTDSIKGAFGGIFTQVSVGGTTNAFASSARSRAVIRARPRRRARGRTAARRCDAGARRGAT